MQNDEIYDGGVVSSAEPTPPAHPTANCKCDRPGRDNSQAPPALKLFDVDYVETHDEWQHLTIAAPADCQEDDLAIAISNVLAQDEGPNCMFDDVECQAIDSAEVAELNLADESVDFVLTRDEHGKLVRR